MTDKKRIIIIGGVAGGMSAATRLRRLDEAAEITVFEQSGYVSYANCGLPYYAGGSIEFRDALILQTPEGLGERFRLNVKVAHEVTAINPTQKNVTVTNLTTGEHITEGYDKLILSPGATTIKPDIPGIEFALPLRIVEDVDRLVAALEQQPRHATVIGGGFIGLEAVENLRARGVAVTLLEAAPQVLTPLDVEMVPAVMSALMINEVDVRLSTTATEIRNGSVILSNGEELATDLVLLAIGVRPNITLAQAAGLEIGPRGGIAVDSNQLTSNPDIYAVGDAVEKTDLLTGEATLVPLANLANRHGRVVADHICGIPVREVPAIGTAIVKVFETVAATTGWNERRLKQAGRSFQVIHTHPGSHAGYYPGAEQIDLKLLFDPKSGQILGAQAVGGEGVDKRIDVIATAIRGGITAPELMDLELAYAPPFGSAKDPINMLGYVADNIMRANLKTIQWYELADQISAGATLLDVRTNYEFGRGNIPGAINIPLNELRDRMGELPAQKPVIVYCRVGQTAHTATKLLQQAGFEVRNLDGGYLTWADSPAGA